jgi:hypothetical protein
VKLEPGKYCPKQEAVMKIIAAIQIMIACVCVLVFAGGSFMILFSSPIIFVWVCGLWLIKGYFDSFYSNKNHVWIYSLLFNASGLILYVLDKKTNWFTGYSIYSILIPSLAGTILAILALIVAAKSPQTLEPSN